MTACLTLTHVRAECIPRIYVTERPPTYRSVRCVRLRKAHVIAEFGSVPPWKNTNTGHPGSGWGSSGVKTRARHLLRSKSSTLPTGRGSEEPGITCVLRIEGSHGNSCTC